jgi:hypothetical protein
VRQAGCEFSMLDYELIEVLDKFLDSWIGIFEYRLCFDDICQFIMSSKTFEFYARLVIRSCSREHLDRVCMLAWSPAQGNRQCNRKERKYERKYERKGIYCHSYDGLPAIR